jgi:hypothetical protein
MNYYPENSLAKRLALKLNSGMKKKAQMQGQFGPANSDSMSEDKFWSLIEQAEENSDILKQLLLKLPPEDIHKFYQIYLEKLDNLDSDKMEKACLDLGR